MVCKCYKRTSKAVSYTHLDVYKRQILNQLEKMNSKFDSRFDSNDIKLDRQSRDFNVLVWL